MGFFSFNCKECHHPMLSRHAVDPGINEWMTQAVALTPDGSRIVGEYDGYGRVGNMEDAMDGAFEAAYLHRACWEIAGKPEYEVYGEPSRSAADQGYFFNDGDHDMIDPRIKEGWAELLRSGIEARNKRRAEDKKVADELDVR